MRSGSMALLTLFAAMPAIAASIIATLYTAKIYGSNLNNVTGRSDYLDRVQAANLAYRQQTVNKTAVPADSLMKVVYKDGSYETAASLQPQRSAALCRFVWNETAQFEGQLVA